MKYIDTNAVKLFSDYQCAGLFNMDLTTSVIGSSMAETPKYNLLSQINRNRSSSYDNTPVIFSSPSPDEVVCTAKVLGSSDSSEDMITNHYSFSKTNTKLFAEDEVMATEIVLMMLSELRDKTKSRGKSSFRLPAYTNIILIL